MNEQYFVPDFITGEWKLNEEFTPFPKGSATFYFYKPISKLIFSYYMQLKPTSDHDFTFIAADNYKEIVLS